MKHKTTKALFEYWNSIRSERIAPRRSEIEPREIKRLLPYVFILERSDKWSYRFRLAGTGLCNAYGMEFRRHNLLSMWQDECLENMTHLLNDVTSSATVGLVEYTAQTADERQVNMEMMLLPLAQENGEITRILGAAVPMNDLPWLGEPALPRQWIDRMQLLDPAQMPVAPAVAAIASRISREAPPRPISMVSSLTTRRARLKSERPYLRLIKSEAPTADDAH